jgi:hypothetical protein
MAKRKISEEEVVHVVNSGITIEVYADSSGELVFCWCGSRPLHVVFVIKEIDKTKLIITAYQPDESRWEDNFRRRKL